MDLQLKGKVVLIRRRQGMALRSLAVVRARAIAVLGQGQRRGKQLQSIFRRLARPVLDCTDFAGVKLCRAIEATLRDLADWTCCQQCRINDMPARAR